MLTLSDFSFLIVGSLMETLRRDEIARSLRILANNHRSTMELLEHMLALVSEEFALDPFPYFKLQQTRRNIGVDNEVLTISSAMLSVTFRGKTCFLGYTLPFKLLAYLAQRPNTFVSYEELLSDVWQCVVSEGAVRSVVKKLRCLLRNAGLAELANAIDGSAYGHYALKLSSLRS
jgi:DNA-binding response OmpR family regulator